MKRAMNHAEIPTRCLILSLFAVCSISTPALADILVMADGSRLEIEGEWRDEGRVIEFTLPNGTLGSVRASEVDLDASRRATEAAARAAEATTEEPEEEPKPEPVAVWTDKDIPRASPEVISGATASVQAESVQVTDWQVEQAEDRGLVALITGTLQNYGAVPVSDLSLSVTVVGDRANGANPSLVRQARLTRTTLDPGETATFEVELRRSDVVSVGTLDEFESPEATFDVAFTGNTSDAGEDQEDESADDGEG